MLYSYDMRAENIRALDNFLRAEGGIWIRVDRIRSTDRVYIRVRVVPVYMRIYQFSPFREVMYAF
jgi:hypothetical protein